MAWYNRKDKKFKDSEKKSIPDGLWEKCISCDEVLFRPELDKNLCVCHHCQHHFRVSSAVYLDLLLDKGSETQLFSTLESKDFLGFKAGKKYSTQITGAKRKTGDHDAIKVYSGKLNEKPIILGVMNFAFIGGSMGSVVGEACSVGWSDLQVGIGYKDKIFRHTGDGVCTASPVAVSRPSSPMRYIWI